MTFLTEEFVVRFWSHVDKTYEPVNAILSTCVVALWLIGLVLAATVSIWRPA